MDSIQEREFEQFVTGSGRRLLRTAVLLVGDLGHAEDLVQVALERRRGTGRGSRARPRRTQGLWSHGWRPTDGGGRTGGQPKCSSSCPVRRTRRTSQPRWSTARHWSAALRTLTARQRAVLVLRYFDDLSEQQTADALGVSTAPSRPLRAGRSPGCVRSSRRWTPNPSSRRHVHELDRAAVARRDDRADRAVPHLRPGTSRMAVLRSRRTHRTRVAAASAATVAATAGVSVVAIGLQPGVILEAGRRIRCRADKCRRGPASRWLPARQRRSRSPQLTPSGCLGARSWVGCATACRPSHGQAWIPGGRVEGAGRAQGGHRAGSDRRPHRDGFVVRRSWTAARGRSGSGSTLTVRRTVPGRSSSPTVPPGRTGTSASRPRPP